MVKRRWLLFSCLAITFVAVVVAAIIGYVGFSAFKEVAQEEFSQLDAIPQAQPLTPLPATEHQVPNLEIHDLAYIKVFSVGYSDDADPEDDGIAVDISFYDSRSELLEFSKVPIDVVIELYAYRDIVDAFDQDKAELVYRGSIPLDHSMRLGEIMGHYIRIPFEEISVDQGSYVPFGTLKVVVETPNQGDFEGNTDLVPLFPYEE